jgi:ubiquinone/menaquinone biosynthesis C-methylase UbiE
VGAPGDVPHSRQTHKRAERKERATADWRAWFRASPERTGVATEKREWERWDDKGVAQSIESYWNDSALEKTHREALTRLCALYIPVPDVDVLEVGCGSGLIYEGLVPRLIPNERYTGVDVSREMLAIARRKHPEARFLEGDGYGLQFEDGEFNVTLAFEVLGHIPEVGPFLRELLRVTRDLSIFTVWPAADGAVQTSESICGSHFLHRNYSHEYVTQQIIQWFPDVALEMDVGILHAQNWAYVLRRREGRPGPTLSRLFPVSGA